MTDTRFLAPPEEPGELGRLGLYRVRRVLRCGDTAMVLEAEDPQAHRAVTLEVFSPKCAADAEARQRFFRCAQGMASLDHGHIAEIVEVGEWNNLPYFVMSLLPGEMLDDRLTREGRLPLLDVLRFGWEIAEALAAIHERQLAHGNLTAGNVWLEPAERSTPATPHNRAGGKPLTLANTSDEPAVTDDHVRLLDVAMTGSTADWRDDLLALGWLLYRMSTGVAPFANVTVPAIVRTAELPPPKPPAQIDSGIPLEVSQLILDLLPTDATSEVPSALVVARRLHELHDLLTWRGVAPRRYAVEPSGALGGLRGSRGCLIVAIALVALVAIVAPIGYFAERFWTRVLDPPLGPQIREPRAEQGEPRPPNRAEQGELAAPDLVLDDVQAGVALPRGPCPLDRLDPAQVPASERFGWQPKELVAVIGTHRQRHWGPTYAIALSPECKEVATAGQDGIRFWDAATLAPRGGPLGPAVKTLGFVAGADGPRLAIGTDRLHFTTRRSGPLQDDDLVLTTGTMIHTLAISAAGTRLAIAGEAGQVEVWDAPTRKTVAVMKPAWPTMASSQGCALTAEGHWLAYLVKEDTVRVMDMSGPAVAEFARIEPEVAIAALAFAPTGRRLALAAWDGAITLWDFVAVTAVKQATIEAAGRPVCVRFAPDGRRLAVSYEDEGVQVWDIGAAKPVLRQTLPHGTGLTSFVFTANGKAMVTVNRGIVRRWELTAAQPLQDPPLSPARYVEEDPGQSLLTTPDGSRIVARTIDGQVRVWDLTGPAPRERTSAKGEPVLALPTALATDGKTLATFDSERPPFLQLWSLTGPDIQLTDRAPPKGMHRLLAFSADGKRAYGATRGAELRTWDATGPRLRELSTVWTGGATATAMRLSPDGRTLAWLDGLGVTLWDVTGERPHRRAWLHGKELVHDVAFGPGGKTLLCAAAQSGLTAWDLSGAEPQRRGVPAVEGGATSVCCRPDGRQFAWADQRGEVVLWDLGTRAAARRWRLPGIVDRVFITTDGRHLLMHNNNGTVYVLRLAPPS